VRDDATGTTVEARATLVKPEGARSFDELARAGAVLFERAARRKVTIDVARGRMRLTLRVRLDASGRSALDIFELTEGGVVLARTTGDGTEVTVTLEGPDAGVVRAARVIVSPKEGDFERFELLTPVREVVRAAP
jgi:hypothetical protein